VRIFDSHIHLSEFADDILKGYAKLNGLKYDLRELLQLMDTCKIAGGLLLSSRRKNGELVSNQHILELARRGGGKLKPVITVEPDPRHVEESLELAARNHNVKGFKVMLGYHDAKPESPVFEPVYRYAVDHEMPVMFHTGDTAVSSGRLLYAHPLLLDRLSVRIPDLKVVICHMGNPWIRDASAVVYKNTNVYADLSGLFSGKSPYMEKYLNFLLNELNGAIYYVGSADKFIFGTDYPVEHHQAAIELVKRLEIKRKDLKKILYENAARLFRL
jgi:predicted TIM-barrel fold metal-dependent hydrolase